MVLFECGCAVVSVRGCIALSSIVVGTLDKVLD